MFTFFSLFTESKEIMASTKFLLPLVLCIALASAWPWSDYELVKASKSDLEKYAKDIFIKNKLGKFTFFI